MSIATVDAALTLAGMDKPTSTARKSIVQQWFSPKESQRMHALVRELGPYWKDVTKILNEEYDTERTPASVRNHYIRSVKSATAKKKNMCRVCGVPKLGHICTGLKASKTVKWTRTLEPVQKDFTSEERALAHTLHGALGPTWKEIAIMVNEQHGNKRTPRGVRKAYMDNAVNYHHGYKHTPGYVRTSYVDSVDKTATDNTVVAAPPYLAPTLICGPVSSVWPIDDSWVTADWVVEPQQ